MTGGVHVVWFKRDLRVADHAPLAAAAAQGPVLPLFIVEPAFWQQPDASARQWAFAAECLAALQQDLARLGQALCIKVGDTIDVLADIHARVGIAALWSHQETGNGWTYARDKKVAAWLRAQGRPWHELPQTGVIRRLKSRNGWARAWDREMAKPITAPPVHLVPIASIEPGAIPSARELGMAADPCPQRQIGGRRSALATLDSFLHRRGRDYRFEMSSPLTAFHSSSRISPYLTWGTLSMREVAHATWTRLRDLEIQATTNASADARRWRGSMISFSGRQHWHCHFMQKLEDEPGLEFRNLHRAYDGLRPERADTTRLQAWSVGETGLPFVDACMRALAQHGWINFRMRAMLMSFASYHLWLPWRDSGLHLARQFIDYEPGIHWSQAQMQSGTTGINTMRIYNPVKQGYDQDPAGMFVRRFVPELAEVPDAYIHEPWRWVGAGRLLGKLYPEPLVDHAAAAQAARVAVYNVRKSQSHKVTAAHIVEKHGSRKSGMPMTGRVKPAKPKAAAKHSQQLVLDI